LDWLEQRSEELSDRSGISGRNESVKSSTSGLPRLIALFKQLRAAVLIAVGVGALKLLHKDFAAAIEHWVELLRLGTQIATPSMSSGENLKCHARQDQAAWDWEHDLCRIVPQEGIGLWLERRWAEWLAAIITGSLIPIEMYEIYRQPSGARIVVLVINTAMGGVSDLSDPRPSF
jgi:hypothetical protein